VGRFLERHRVPLYSEHLSWCSDDGHLYDLLPLPFTEEAVEYVAARIRRVQDILGRRIAVENVSYYATLPVPAAQALDEADFVNAVLERADCDLLLDVNNIHVNAVNHRYDAHRFLRRMPSARIACYHVAGHHDEAPGLKVDTHGAQVRDEVWDLLAEAYRVHGVRPTLLERDFNFPPFDVLLAELARIRGLQRDAAGPGARAARGGGAGHPARAADGAGAPPARSHGGPSARRYRGPPPGRLPGPVAQQYPAPAVGQFPGDPQDPRGRGLGHA